MIIGIGNDIIEIDRVKKALERNPKLLQRLFTQYEILYFEKRNMNIQHIAGGFAAKEAVVKALGTGLRGFKWTDVEILRGATGKPMVKFYNKAKDLASDFGIETVFITISHSCNYAMATAVAQASMETIEKNLEEMMLTSDEESRRSMN